MRKLFSRISRVVNRYPQPENVKEWSLLSRYELIWYICLLLICGFIFLKWNSPQRRDIYVEAEASMDHETICEADIQLPMTVMKKEDGHVTVHVFPLSFSNLNKYDFYSRRSYLLSLLTGHDSSGPVLGYVNVRGEINSAHALFSHSTIKGEKTDITQTHIRRGLFIKGWNTCFYHNRDSVHIKSDVYYSGNTTNAFGRPRWYSFFDISQTHLYIHAKSKTCDSLVVNLDFCGPADIYDIEGVTGTTTGSRSLYSFSNKGGKGIDSTIHVYARLKDLEDWQTIRMFAITAILSSLLAILVAFIIIFVYRVTKADSQQKEKEGSPSQDV